MLTCTPVKDMDTRCSTRCVQNWTKYNQCPPIGHYCKCTGFKLSLYR